VESKLIDEISRRVADLAASTPIGDLQKNLRALLVGWLEKMDLVSREELDAQRDVLARTREKLEQMEARVEELEAKTGKAADGRS